MLTADLSCWLESTNPIGPVGEYTCIMGTPVGESLLEIWGLDWVFVAMMLVAGMSDTGRGEVDSERELIPEVLEESVPLMLFCWISRLSAGMGMGLTTEFETGDPVLKIEELSATVLVDVGEMAMLVNIFC